MGIPEMRARGYPDEVATGSICAGGTLGILIPPSITFILYGIATETSIGRSVPGRRAAGPDADRPVHAVDAVHHLEQRLPLACDAGFPLFAGRRNFNRSRKIAPFLLIIIGVMYVLYGGIATPSEAAGVGAALCVVLAVVIYRMWARRPGGRYCAITTRESVMILMIIATAVLFGYMLTSLYITQTLAQAIADAQLNDGC